MGTSIHVFLQYTHHIHFVFGCICAFVHACIYVISLVYYIYIRTSTYIWHMYLSYLVSTCYKSWILVKYVFPSTALHLQSNLLMTMIRLLYVTKAKHHASPQVTLSKRAADSLALASAFGKENGANNNRNNNNNNNNNWAGPWNSPQVKTCFLFEWLIRFCWVDFCSPIWDYLSDGSLDFVGCSQERPSRIPDAGGPSRSRPWTWPPGTCQSCHEFVAAAPVHVATCFGSGRGAATQGGRKLAVRFWEELLGFWLYLLRNDELNCIMLNSACITFD